MVISFVFTACPPGLTFTPSVTITTNDVILITAPWLPYTDAANAYECLRGGYAAGNASEFFDRRPQFYNQTQEAFSTLRSLVTTNLGERVIVWFGPRSQASDGICPDFEVTDAIATGLVDCQQQFAIVCSRSKKGERSIFCPRRICSSFENRD